MCWTKKSPFLIRQWVQNDTLQSWLFISSTGDRHETLRPLITAWLDIAINALLSLPEKSSRRIWIILDELGSLQQVPYLTSALAEARKFGGCFVIGVQSIAQLAKLYGSEGAKEISSLLNTRFLFRSPDSGNCLMVSEEFGRNHNRRSAGRSVLWGQYRSGWRLAATYRSTKARSESLGNSTIE